MTTHALAALHEAAPVVHPAAASGSGTLIVLVILLPAISAAILLLGGRRTDRWGHLLGTATPLISFVLGLILFFTLLGRDAGDRSIQTTPWTWFTAGSYRVQLGLLYDQLAALFVLLITGVGSLIHIYSIGYMAHDPRRRRFFAHLNLFVASMLMLVLASDYLGLFLGWEGVGLASYLLIGFWQAKPSAAAAAKKAFVVNRVGDMGLSLAIGLMVVTFGTTSFAGVSTMAPHASHGALTAIGLLLLLGACGKSAQFPLHTWLLDAMEGPTPVSALIHAATMVTAGVYLITRSNFIFEGAPHARTVVAIVGCITLLLGAIIGCAKDDIKKSLAGSTMSQIGYMILATGLGVAGYPFAIFHLLTHGFFKANLFLGAGSIMHGMDDDVDMRHYGGLRKYMPVTFVTFGLAYLAIIGFPGLSGFWSKDKIIETALTNNWLVGVCALVGAGITGFYMTRMMLMTFFGKKRWEPGVHPHESPRVMTVPLIVLAALSVLGGMLLLGDWIVKWLGPVVGVAAHEEPPIPAYAISIIAIVVVAIGVGIAWTTYGSRDVPRVAPAGNLITHAARAELYGDDFNREIVAEPGKRLVAGLGAFDRDVVDGLVRGTAGSMEGIGAWLRRAQNGYVRSYALSILGGCAVLLLALVVVNFG